MKEKRTGKRKAPSHDILQKEEIIIQRLGTEVSGKTQKDSRTGPREFVAYELEYDEVTLDSIKQALCPHSWRMHDMRRTCR